jgi:hypothetical protein
LIYSLKECLPIISRGAYRFKKYKSEDSGYSI